MRRAGIGRLTRRYNPGDGGAHSLGQYLNAVLSLRGEGGTMSVSDAVATVRATPQDARSEFAREIWSRRREHYGPTGRSDGPPF